MQLPPEPAFLAERAEARAWILTHARRGGVGAEVGVFRGHFAAIIARDLKPKKLYLIDGWKKMGDHFGWSDEMTNFDTLTTADAMRDTHRRMGPYKNDTEIIYAEEWFDEFAEKYSGEKWDFVYLDTSHTYEGTARELKILDTMIARDGVIMGDDWNPDVTHRHHGVMRAVNEFVKTYDWQIVAASQDGQFCLRRAPTY